MLEWREFDGSTLNVTMFRFLAVLDKTTSNSIMIEKRVECLKTDVAATVFVLFFSHWGFVQSTGWTQKKFISFRSSLSTGNTTK